MSKARQRKESAKHEKQKMFDLGAQAAKWECFASTFWRPGCMAWRAGFLRNGGEKFW